MKTFVVLIIVLVTGLGAVFPVCQSIVNKAPACSNTVQDCYFSLKSNPISTLPSASINLYLQGGFMGTAINATLSFGFWQFSDGNLGVGFRQERLVVGNGLVSVAVTGLGYDEMREYPFIYYEDAVLYDFWKNGFPTWISYKPYPWWTETRETTTYNGPISLENVSMLVKTGDIVEFENLTIYFDDGSSFICGPQLITVGVNFTQTETGWTIQRILNVSDHSGVTIGDDSITISLRGSVPLHPVFLGLIITVPAVVVVGAIWWRRRKLQSKKSETE